MSTTNAAIHMLESTESVVIAIVNERERQDEQWGPASHHDQITWLAILAKQLGHLGNAALLFDEAIADNRLAHELIRHAERIRHELVQIAAVAVAAAEDLDRNELRR